MLRVPLSRKQCAALWVANAPNRVVESVHHTAVKA
jgi:hypothetical protein